TYRKHMESLRERLSRSMGQTSARLEALGIEPWIEPRGGMFLWCKLPEGLDATDVARRALAENVILAPGNAFSVAQSASQFLRFNVAQSTDPRVFTVLKAAMHG
ncbi:MAG: GntR family transcriptional regulator, partial [Caballeronia sp.]|uniref:aminotransferase class I/II-fold pyridoxal phosphate-dependent enzyme n=1 Tax=Caballeronia sp. TaxID=1931223 RepID=UPI00260C04DB